MPRTGMPRYAICFVLFTVARLKLFWEKRQHQNHNSTKSSKIWFSTLFQVEFEQKKMHSQNQDSAKRYHFSTLFQVEFEQKKTTTKTKIIRVEILRLDFQGKSNAKNRYAAVCHLFVLLLLLFTVARLKLFLEKRQHQNQDSTKSLEILMFQHFFTKFLAIRLEFPEKSNAKNRYAAVCHLFVLFTVARLILFLGKKATPKPRLDQKLFKFAFFNTFSNRTWKGKQQPKPRLDQSCHFFSTFSSRIWKETTTTKTKILRVKMRIFNFLAIRLEFPKKSNAKNRYAAVCHLFVLFTVARLKLFWEKRQHQNHNSTKSSKIWFFSTFSSRIWAEKNAQPKPSFGQKVPFFNTFSSGIWTEKATTKTKIIRVEILRLDFQGKSNAKNRYAAVCHLFVLFTVARLILFLGKKATSKPRFDQKLRFVYFSTLFQIELEKKNNNQNPESTKCLEMFIFQHFFE